MFEIKNKESKKVSFATVKKYNGIDYKSGRLTFSPLQLERLGISEDCPNVEITYDIYNKQIVIKAVNR